MAMTAQGKASSVHYRLGYNNTMGMAAESKASLVFNRLGKVTPSTKKTCIYWAKGRCSKVNCQFMHSEQPAQKTRQFLAPKKHQSSPKTKHSADSRTKQRLAPQIKQLVADHLKPCNVDTSKRKMTWRNDNLKSGSPPAQKQEPESRTMASKSEDNEVDSIKCPKVDLVELKTEDVKGTGVGVKTSEPQGNCVKDDKRESLHSWSEGFGLTKLAELKGHSKAITGIVLPSGSTNLYSASKDKNIRLWDCCSGQCSCTESLNDEVACMITRGPWIFAGLLNKIKAWNLEHKIECPLNVTGGRVHSLEFENDVLFAGMEDGSILVWKRNPETNEFVLVAKPEGHTGPVHALIMGSGHGKLYSASADCSVKVWDQYMQCIQTLHGHTREVTSLLCWNKYVLSASLDKTLKVWGLTESGTLEMVHELKEDHGFVSIGGVLLRPEAQSMLLCSLKDKSVRLYNFSFVEKGRISTKEQASAIQVGVDGLFFIGDEAGDVSAWRLA